MNLISVTFLIFLTVLFIIYFILPLKVRWMWLLIGNCVFYACGGWKSLPFLFTAELIAYAFPLWIKAVYRRAEESVGTKKNDPAVKRRARWILLLGVLLLLSMLVYSKSAEKIMIAFASIFHGEILSFPVIIPLGISYYTFAAIGYMADVYWKKDEAERNPLKLFLYLTYFPHITQGPIPRHKRLAPQLTEGHRFEYNRVCFGLQRIIWGLFKKLVIADRFALIVREVIGNYEKYEGLTLVVAVMASAIQLYADFSGCMDIVLGISEVLGITLEENFQRPFFAKSAAEFWRRWHITLGAWFKDYVYMPLVVSPFLMKLSNGARKVFGKRFARCLLSIIPLIVVWLLTGLWHGTGKNYIAWGAWWGGIIIFSTVFAPELKKLTKLLHINTNSIYWQVFQMVRTFLLFCVGRLLTAPGHLRQSWEIVKRTCSRWNPWIFFDGTLYQLGLDRPDFWVGILSLLFLWYISVQQEKGVRIRQKIASYPIVIRWAIYYGAVFAVLIFGMYGSGHSAGGFIYAQY